MVEASPKVPIDSPHSLSIPTLASSILLLSFAKPQFNTDKSTHYANSILMSQGKKPCDCPQILVCDDDSFQTMYYKLLFESLNSYEDSEKKIAPKFELFASGEELLHRYMKIKQCGCESLQLAITDYNMGYKKLNGVDTILSLRENGFSGHVMLRTSETKDYLSELHPQFPEMLENGMINCFQDKNQVKETKSLIQKLVEAK